MIVYLIFLVLILIIIFLLLRPKMVEALELNDVMYQVRIRRIPEFDDPDKTLQGNGYTMQIWSYQHKTYLKAPEWWFTLPYNIMAMKVYESFKSECDAMYKILQDEGLAPPRLETDEEIDAEILLYNQ